MKRRKESSVRGREGCDEVLSGMASWDDNLWAETQRGKEENHVGFWGKSSQAEREACAKVV